MLLTVLHHIVWISVDFSTLWVAMCVHGVCCAIERGAPWFDECDGEIEDADQISS